MAMLSSIRKFAQISPDNVAQRSLSNWGICAVSLLTDGHSIRTEQMKKPVLAITALAALAGPPHRRRQSWTNAPRPWSISARPKKAIRAFGKRDADQSASMYAPNATLMLTNMPAVKLADIGPLLKDMMAAPNFSMTFHTAKVEALASGEFGYTRGA